jgi:hypothetical protein
MEDGMRREWIGMFASLLLVPRGAAAQDVQLHERFWMGFGVGFAQELSRSLDAGRLGGGGWYFRMGGTPRQQILIGFEALGWTRTTNDVTLTRGTATLTLLGYPDFRGGLFFKAGVGTAYAARDEQNGNRHTTDTDGGFGATVGAGYDLRLGRNVYLTPNVDYVFQALDSGVSNHIVLLTVGVTWH